ncbi:MAG: hypothetical protein RIG77_12730 [Cyclobacteriaceae bacterium]
MKTNNWEAKTKKNVRQLAYCTGCWMLTMALVAFGPKFFWDYNPIISVLLILLNTVIGIVMISVNRKYINGLDEMHRKLSLDAMAIALGVGVVGGLSYSMLDTSNVISFDAEISHLVILISLTYLVATVVGKMRYQ